MRILLCLLLLTVTSTAQTKQTDRDFEGFKGNVRTVLTERADTSLRRGKLFEMKRRKNEFVAFDAAGMRTAYKMYHWESGLPFESITYKLVDGDRASVYQDFNAFDRIVSMAPPEDPPKPRDARYAFKHKYRYDEKGRITEEAWWQNDGDFWMRYVYTYADNVKHELVYDEHGKLNQKYSHLLNENGEIVETVSFDANDPEEVEGRDRYEYVTRDRLGNWTKRIEYESEDGIAPFKPRETKYRTITYNN